jgi:hypothetical protein
MSEKTVEKKQVSAEEAVKVLQREAEERRAGCVREIEAVLKKYGKKLTVVQTIQVTD